MGLKCLLGHDFDEPETEREREERGDEVVITVRQVKTCRRCGERQVVSENKEVTALEQLLDAADTVDPAGDDAPATETPVDGRSPDATPSDARNGSGSPSAADPGGATFADGEFEPPQSADEDNGIILDDDDDDPPERRPGEWPDADATRRGAGGGGRDDASASAADGSAADAGNGGWPTVEGEDEGYSAGSSANGGPDGVSFGAGLTPDGNDGRSGGDAGDRSTEVGGPPDEGAELLDDEPSDGDALAPDSGIVDRGADSDGSDDEARSDGFTRADSPSVDGPPSTGAGRAEFHCPECDLARPAVGSSLRSGDICPDCHSGYITEREN